MVNKRIKKNFIINIVYQIILILMTLLVIPYVSRVLGEEGVGKYSFANTINTFFILFSALGFTLYGKREIAQFQNNKKQQSIIFWEINLCRLIFVVLFTILNFILVFCGVFGSYSTLIVSLVSATTELS